MSFNITHDVVKYQPIELLFALQVTNFASIRVTLSKNNSDSRQQRKIPFVGHKFQLMTFLSQLFYLIDWNITNTANNNDNCIIKSCVV